MSEAEAWAEAAAAGIHRLALPTPFPVGRVNCYLIEDSPLTLLDTGPNSGRTLDELEQALAVHGRRTEDLELILMTHQHVDHLGLVEVLARRSGAEVAALDLLAAHLQEPQAAAADERFVHDVMRRHGVPEDLAAMLGSMTLALRAFGCRARVTQPLADGAVLTLRDRSLQVAHRPGHSPSDTTFWDPASEILLGGDHLLAHISSNPLLARPLRGDSEQRPRALVEFTESMAATRELPARLVLPGHGPAIRDHARLIDERLRMHRRRAEKIAGLLADGSRTAWELAGAMWGSLALTQAHLTLSEALGHLDLLERDGRVRAQERDGQVSYALEVAAGV